MRFVEGPVVIHLGPSIQALVQEYVRSILVFTVGRSLDIGVVVVQVVLPVQFHRVSPSGIECECAHDLQAFHKRHLIGQVERAGIPAADVVTVTVDVPAGQSVRVFRLGLGNVGEVIGIRHGMPTHTAVSDIHPLHDPDPFHPGLLTVLKDAGCGGIEGKVLRDVGRDRSPEVDPLVVDGVALEKAFIVIVAKARKEPYVPGAAPQTDAVALGGREFLGEDVHPVEVLIPFISIEIMVNLFLGVLGDRLVVQLEFILKLIEGSSVNRGFLRGRVLERGHAGVIHLHLPFLTLLGRDDHNTVGRTHTIDGCGSILQDRDGLDVVAAEGSQFGSVSSLHAVDDEQRRAETTDADEVVELTRFAGLLTDHETRDLTLDVVDQVVGLRGADVFGRYGRYGTGQGFLLCDTVAHNHGILNDFRILLEDYVVDVVVTDRKGPCDESHGDDIDDCAFVDAQGVVAVHVGRCSDRCPLHQYGCGGNGLPRHISDGTADRFCLGHRIGR